MITSYYKSTIYIDTTNVVNLNVTQNNIDKTDFETNYLSLAVQISEAEFLDTSLNTNVSFSDFKTYVIDWTNARYLIKDNRYELFTLQDTEIDTVQVEATIVGGNVNISSIVNDCNKFFSDIHTIISKNDTIIRTYTVPSNKTFRLVAWQINADHPLAIDAILKVNNIAIIKFYLDPSQGHDSNYFYTEPVLIANANDVITIEISPSTPRGELNSILTGIES